MAKVNVSMRLHSFMVVGQINTNRLFMSIIVICEMFKLTIFNDSIDSTRGMRIFGSFYRIGILNNYFYMGISTQCSQ